jgi:hypothetical protein
MMHKVLLIVTALAAGGLAEAQTTPSASSPAKKELVARMLAIQQPGIEAMARSLAEEPAKALMQQASQALRNLPPERRETVARDIENDLRKYVEEASPIVRDRALKLAPTTVGALLEERFSEDELKQILVLLDSPVNKKFQALAPELQRSLGEKLVADTRPEVEVKVRALEKSISNRLAGSAGGTSGASKAPAAAPAAPKKQ